MLSLSVAHDLSHAPCLKLYKTHWTDAGSVPTAVHAVLQDASGS